MIVVTAYSVYDSAPRTATGTATGVLGESLAGLDFSGTTHTNAVAAHMDTITFTDVTGNYNDASRTVSDEIKKADADHRRQRLTASPTTASRTPPPARPRACGQQA